MTDRADEIAREMIHRVTEEDGQHLRWMLYKGEWCCDPTEDADELARLAAENTRLREQVRWVIGRINHKPEFSEVAEQLKRTLEEKP